jgi:anti-sigma factor RsiW
MVDPITEADLHAFIDGQLDVTRQIEVEDYLAHRPEVTAQLMADMRARDVLKLAFADEPARPSRRELEAARRLERSFAWRQATASRSRWMRKLWGPLLSLRRERPRSPSSPRPLRDSRRAGRSTGNPGLWPTRSRVPRPSPP